MDRLEDETRSGESSADLILLLRGGEDTREKLIRQADLLATRFTYEDRPARGISLFAATGDLDARVLLGTKFRSFPKYRRIEAALLGQTRDPAADVPAISLDDDVRRTGWIGD